MFAIRAAHRAHDDVYQDRYNSRHIACPRVKRRHEAGVTGIREFWTCLPFAPEGITGAL